MVPAEKDSNVGLYYRIRMEWAATLNNMARETLCGEMAFEHGPKGKP